MYRVVVERAAEKDLRRLSSEIRKRAALALVALCKNPRPSGSRKLVGTENEWRIRVGDYRILQLNHHISQLPVTGSEGW